MTLSRLLLPVRPLTWRFKTLAVATIVVGAASSAVAGGNGSTAAKPHPKLDRELTFRSDHSPGSDVTPVIVTLRPGAQLPPQFKHYQREDGELRLLNGQVLALPNGALKQLAAHSDVVDLHYDRPAVHTNYRTSLTTGSREVNRGLGFTGAGVGVAVIDSGIARWHDDLTSRSTTLYPYGNQRVSAFVDLVRGQLLPYDDDGHGTHVAGIIAGNGYDSNGQNAGVAPDASLAVLKVLDANGQGTISNIIKAFDWVLANRTRYKIRVVNLSVGAAVTESYWTDPLTLGAKRLVDAGVVVVCAAGNLGKNAKGEPQYGGITAPGNAPWVVTVGASSTNGTPGRGDDTMASFSSRGPTYLDWSAKPDLVAPGVGTVSLSDPWGTMYSTGASYLAWGTVPTPYKPYLSLSGTSMAAPVVTGTVALMLQANPNLTPNAVKAILQYTAQVYAAYNPLTQGAGFLDTLGAVRLARFYATTQPGQKVPVQSLWGKRVIWGNHLLKGGVLNPLANAFALGTTWGAATAANGDNIVWGTGCSAGCDNIVWGTRDGDNIVWGTGSPDNIVWGTNVVWGTSGDDNIVWGTACGGNDCDNIVWGTSGVDNIVWGTGCTAGCDNIVWGTGDHDNIVWGTGCTGGCDNIVWGTNVVWGTSATSTSYGDPTVTASLALLELYLRAGAALTDSQVFQWIASLTSGGF